MNYLLRILARPANKFALFAAASCILAAASTNSYADLVLNVDTGNQTISLRGSDTLTFGNFGTNPYKIAQWNFTNLGGGGAPTGLISLDGMWTSSVGSPTAGFGGTSFYLGVDNQVGGRASVILFNSLPGPSAVAGTGLTVSYAGFAPANRVLLESLIGSSAPILVGAGNNLAVTVPEPSSLFLLSLGGLALLRRQRN